MELRAFKKNNYKDKICHDKTIFKTKNHPLNKMNNPNDDNRADQMNPNNEAYWYSRGEDYQNPDTEDELKFETEDDIQIFKDSFEPS